MIEGESGETEKAVVVSLEAPECFTWKHVELPAGGERRVRQ
jgi:hypothetical protein